MSPECQSGYRGNYSVVWDVILSKELIKLDIIWVAPPLLPLAGIVCGDGCITNASIKPSVDNFVFIARERDRSSPLHVSGNASWFQALLQPRGCDHFAIVGPRTVRRGFLAEGFDFGLQLIQFQENMFGFLCDWCCTVNFATWVFEFKGIKKLTTEITLISMSICIGAVWTLSLNETICKE